MIDKWTEEGWTDPSPSNKKPATEHKQQINELRKASAEAAAQHKATTRDTERRKPKDRAGAQRPSRSEQTEHPREQQPSGEEEDQEEQWEPGTFAGLDEDSDEDTRPEKRSKLDSTPPITPAQLEQCRLAREAAIAKKAAAQAPAPSSPDNATLTKEQIEKIHLARAAAIARRTEKEAEDKAKRQREILSHAIAADPGAGLSGLRLAMSRGG